MRSRKHAQGRSLGVAYKLFNNFMGAKMKKNVVKTSVLLIVAIAFMGLLYGCGSNGVTKTGFLSDYSQLNAVSSTTLRTIDNRALAQYSKFIVDPVEIHFHHGSKAIEERTDGKLTEQNITDVTNYMHNELVKAVTRSGNRVTHQPGAGVARIRVAITDLKKSDLTSVVPMAKLAGVGIGGASMEAEIVDSLTGEQIGAVVESRTGTRIPFVNLGNWDAAKQVTGDWAKRLQKRLEEVR